MRLLGKMSYQDKNKMEGAVEPSEILKRPYARVLIPESDGQYSAEIMEFPGCVAYGENAASALANLESVAVDWIATVVEQGQNIPDPLDSAEYSGKLVIRAKGTPRKIGNAGGT